MPRIMITMRVIALALVGALGVAGLAGLVALSEQKLDASKAREELALLNAQAASAAMSELQELMADYRGVVIDPNRDDLKKVRDHAKRLMILQPEFSETVIAVAAGEELLPAVQAFSDAMVRRGYDEKSGAQRTLRNAAHKIEEVFAEAGGDRREIAHLMVELLMLRRHEKDYIMRGDQKYVDRFTARIDAFAQDLPDAPLNEGAHDAVAEATAKYRESFLNYVQFAGQFDEARNATRLAILRAVDELDRYRASADFEAKKSVEAAAEIRLAADREMKIAAAASIGAVLILGVLIGRSIRVPIKRIAASVNNIAAGEIDTPVPARCMKRRDELGDMARAIDALRRTSVRARELEAEQDEAEARLAEERRHVMQDLQANFSDVVDAAVAGDFSRRLTASDPDLAHLTESVNALLEGVGGAIADANAAMQALAQGDLSARMSGAYEGAFADMQRRVDETIDKLAHLVSQISAATDEMQGQTSGIAMESAQLSERAVAQAAALEETAATVEQVSGAVAANADSAVRANELADESRHDSEKGRDTAAEAVTAMRRIEESSAKISEFVTLVDEIAFQTNLLALNAAVEAARAGEAGKGFAVVAQEVRMLAQRSADSAKDIRGIISDAEARVGEGVSLVEALGGALEHMAGSIGGVAKAVDDISVASREQANGLKDASRAITELDQITQRNASMADSGARAADALMGKAGDLAELIAYFKLDAARVAAMEAEDAAPADDEADGASGSDPDDVSPEQDAA